MSDTKTRPAPPPLEVRCPDCSLCGRETHHDGDSFVCERCGAYWDPNGLDTEDGEWNDPDAEQCNATVQPLAHNTMVNAEARAAVYRCALGLGHDGDHASVDYTYSAKGWKW